MLATSDDALTNFGRTLKVFISDEVNQKFRCNKLLSGQILTLGGSLRNLDRKRWETRGHVEVCFTTFQ